MLHINHRKVGERKEVLRANTHCSLRRVRSHAHAQGHTQVSLRVQFIARAKS